MGVPAFFKWLISRYPKVVIESVENISNDNEINKLTKHLRTDDFESSVPDVDNFYLDMNGIIHPCCHPMNKPQPSTEEEMLNNIFEYTDKLIKIIKPKKLIYMAVDGVAPRAKMNQQRSRRFRAAIEAEEKKVKEKELMFEWKSKGLEVPELKEGSFDTNTITPGTSFMHRLSLALKIYISHRLQFDNNWKGLTVIFSDSSVPGEGEHKILEFIRLQRTSENYNPNKSHCIYGADADLIMLSLITHEPHFYIIRESLNDNQWKKCDLCGFNGHSKEDCKMLIKSAEDVKKEAKNICADIEYSMIKVSVVREYLRLEFKNLKIRFEYDFERIIDDFVFLCFFVGNDFLPNLPSLKIREGAIDALIYLYKLIMPSLDGYLTYHGIINFKRVEKIFEKLAIIEENFFKKQLLFKQNFASNNRNYDRDDIISKEFQLLKSKIEPPKNKDEVYLDDIDYIIQKEDEDEIKIVSQDDLIKDKLNAQASENFQKLLKEKLKVIFILTQKKDKVILETYVDNVRLGEQGWKERYYQAKFKTSYKDQEFINLIKQSYIEGISWVFQYYFNGCVSWEWYYPFHYAPFASDLVNLSDLSINFDMGDPFKPIEQLLSVLPPFSSKALPECLRNLMYDPNSEIIDFYPKNTELDVNGHPYTWMGVNLIPFIDDKRIRIAVSKNLHLFNKEDNERNNMGKTLVYVRTDNFLYKTVGKEFLNDSYSRIINTPQFNVLSGIIKGNSISITPGDTFRTNIDNLNIREVRNCQIVSLVFENLPYSQHESILLKGIKIPTPRITEENLDFIPKKIFRGDQAIQLVRVSLGIIDDTSNINYNQNIQEQIFDYTFNNNRKFDFTPESVNLLRKKRFNEEHTVNDKGNFNSNNHNIHNNNAYLNNNNYSKMNYNNNPYRNQSFPIINQPSLNVNLNDQSNNQYNRFQYSNSANKQAELNTLFLNNNFINNQITNQRAIIPNNINKEGISNNKDNKPAATDINDTLKNILKTYNSFYNK